MVYNVAVITNGAMNASINSQPEGLANVISFAIQAVFTGVTINGSLKLQASCDPINQARNSPPNANQLPTHWTDVTGSTVAIVAAGDVTWNFDMPAYTWVRVVYTDASGGTSDGVLNVRINTKGA